MEKNSWRFANYLLLSIIVGVMYNYVFREHSGDIPRLYFIGLTIVESFIATIYMFVFKMVMFKNKNFLFEFLSYLFIALVFGFLSEAFWELLVRISEKIMF